MDNWQLAVPKALPIVLDGLLYDWGGLWAVLARSIMTGALAVATACAVLARAYSVSAGLVAGLFLIVDRSLWEGTLGGNSTVLLVLFLLGAALALSRRPDGKVGIGALALVTAAALTRQEALAFLGIVGGVFALQARLRGAGAVVARSLLVLSLIAAVLAIHSGASMALTAEGLSTYDIARRNSEMLQAVASDRAAEPGFLATCFGFLARLLRPWFWYLLIVPIGWVALARHSRPAAIIAAALALIPLAYCAVLYQMDLVLFERFLLPTVISAHLCAAVGYVDLWRGAARRLAGSRLHVARSLVVLVALGALGVSLRDAWYSRQGYLIAESKTRSSSLQGLQQLPEPESSRDEALVSGLHYPFVALEWSWDVRQLWQDQFVFASDPTSDRLRRFRHILYDRDAVVMRRLLEPFLRNGADPLIIGHLPYEVRWTSKDGRFKFFRRVKP